MGIFLVLIRFKKAYFTMYPFEIFCLICNGSRIQRNNDYLITSIWLEDIVIFFRSSAITDCNSVTRSSYRLLSFSKTEISCLKATFSAIKDCRDARWSWRDKNKPIKDIYISLADPILLTELHNCKVLEHSTLCVICFRTAGSDFSSIEYKLFWANVASSMYWLTVTWKRKKYNNCEKQISYSWKENLKWKLQSSTETWKNFLWWHQENYRAKCQIPFALIANRKKH